MYLGTTDVEGVLIFYREAGNAPNPVIVLLHGFSHTSRRSPNGARRAYGDALGRINAADDMLVTKNTDKGERGS